MGKLVTKKGWKKSKISKYEQGQKGTDNTVLDEGIPTYKKSTCEIVIPTSEGGKNNTYIVFGRDRPGPQNSGYGGLGASHAGAISIVAGRMGQKAADLDDKGNILMADPDHRTDAAFIYLSQKTDIDKNLGIKPENDIIKDDKIIASGHGQSEAKSGIVIKADNVRMVSRQKIKLVTGTDNKLSTDAESLAVYGIDLTAGNDPTDQQPIVKGDNLKSCLSDLKQEISKLNGIFTAFVGYQLEFNSATLNHYHLVPGPGHQPVTDPSKTPRDVLGKFGPLINSRITNRTIPSLKNNRYELNRIETTYLERGHAKDGKTKYINSLYNTVN